MFIMYIDVPAGIEIYPICIMTDVNMQKFDSSGENIIDDKEISKLKNPKCIKTIFHLNNFSSVIGNFHNIWYKYKILVYRNHIKMFVNSAALISTVVTT